MSGKQHTLYTHDINKVFFVFCFVFEKENSSLCYLIIIEFKSSLSSLQEIYKKKWVNSLLHTLGLKEREKLDVALKMLLRTVEYQQK